ncbi:MAG: ribonuclease H family protein [Nocardioidaceae bacterium]
MKARYAGTCSICRRGIAPGEEIAHRGRGSTTQWNHAECDARDSGEPTLGVAGSAAAGSPGSTEVYTDGACSGNPGPGGWAWAVEGGPEGSGGEPDTTNQRMEIRAALEAVRSLPGALVVVSDSTYVVNCFKDGWWRGWQRRGWVTSAKKPVANRDLWEPLVDLVNERGDVTFRWVKGHSGNPMNDRVDALAVAASHTFS